MSKLPRNMFPKHFSISYVKKLMISLFSFVILKFYEYLPPENYNLVSLFCRECEWTHLHKSRFSFFNELYEKIRSTRNGFGEYNANVFETKLIITDPELVKIVCKEKFSHFAFRPRSTYLRNDHLTHSIFNLDGEVWERRRRQLIRAFAPEILNKMLPQIDDCAEKIVQMLVSDKLKETNVVDASEISRTYVLTILYSCVFGQEIVLQDASSEFARMAKLLRNSDSTRFKLFDFVSCVVPNLRHVFGGTINNNREASDYFKRLIRATLAKKKECREYGCDFLSVFMKFMELPTSEDDTLKWDLEATEAHCVLFLLGGFTATSSTIAFTLYELAKNKHIQEKLTREISERFRVTERKWTLENTNDYSYLDKVIKESLRKYPPFAVNLRICSERCEIPSKNLTVAKGSTVVIPVCGFQRDPTYYPEPDRFDPERFGVEENKIACTYLPFGEGRRRCVGERFAVPVIKMIIIKLLSNFHLSLSGENEILMPNFLPRKFTTTVDKIELILKQRRQTFN